MLEDRLEALFKDPAEYKILERCDWLKQLLTCCDDVMLQVQGEFPAKQEYKPLFPYFDHVSYYCV